MQKVFLYSLIGHLVVFALLFVSLDMPALTGTAGIGASAMGTNVAEAISALVNLGYSRSEAGQVVASVYQQNENASLSDLIRLSLKEIGKNG